MHFKRILFIQPTYTSSHYTDPDRPPPSLGYIAETMRHNDIEYQVIDMQLGYDILDLKRKIRSFNPGLIGITMKTLHYRYIYQMLEEIKRCFPKIPIVAGGPHISTLRNKVLEECFAIDYGVVLEGEETMVELCRKHDPTQIKGLMYRDGDQVNYNGDREFLTPDNIPFPKYEGFELHRYKVKEILIVSSRGCPFKCIYCPAPLTLGSRFRFRSAKNVVDELEYWYGKGYSRFDFCDDNFTLHKDRVYEICDEIERRGLKGLEIHSGNGVRADRVDKELLVRMKEVGWKYLAFGVEAGNDKILKNLKKGEKIKDIERAINEACNLGLEVVLFFLVGSPGETWKDLKDSINIAFKYPIRDVRFYNIIPFPNTELYEWLKEKQFFAKDSQDYLDNASCWENNPIFFTPELSLEERKKALAYTELIRKKVQLRYGLKKYKAIGKIITEFYFSGPFQNLLASNTTVKNIVKTIGKYI